MSGLSNGPWHWTSLPHGVIDDAGVVLAEVLNPGPARGGEDTQDANARAMAAAPELLAACREMEAYCLVNAHVPNFHDPRRRAIQDAIAKATGQVTP